ncbi:hypothetical protein RRG08_003614 [Elysia crispata]|uniref:Uncharacterized protein n=1 Tax=Elysia crispata TaxID=231223 RepID=A0AAE1E5P0_9GAST|nr:hypothetical protein RRG08_003614 [Elysia crispata]
MNGMKRSKLVKITQTIFLLEQDIERKFRLISSQQINASHVCVPRNRRAIRLCCVRHSHTLREWKPERLCSRMFTAFVSKLITIKGQAQDSGIRVNQVLGSVNPASSQTTGARLNTVPQVV